MYPEMWTAVALAQAIGLALTYCLLGVGLLGAGFAMFDAVTPGKLGAVIYQERSLNASLIVGAMTLGLGLVIFTALWTNAHGSLVDALLRTAVFGLVGVLLQTASFLALDAITPGSLRDIAVEKAFHPGSIVAAALMVAVAGIVCASIA